MAVVVVPVGVGLIVEASVGLPVLFPLGVRVAVAPGEEGHDLRVEVAVADRPDAVAEASRGGESLGVKEVGGGQDVEEDAVGVVDDEVLVCEGGAEVPVEGDDGVRTRGSPLPSPPPPPPSALVSSERQVQEHVGILTEPRWGHSTGDWEVASSFRPSSVSSFLPSSLVLLFLVSTTSSFRGRGHP